jgi:transcription antitermination factor NusG
MHNYGGRHREYDIPMFTGYVFGRIFKEDRPWYRQNPNVANIIEVIHEKTFLPPLRAIAEALRSGLDLEVYPDLKPGRKVLITGGPMKGVEAEVLELKGHNKVVLHLELIQQSVAMEIDLAYLKPLT